MLCANKLTKHKAEKILEPLNGAVSHI